METESAREGLEAPAHDAGPHRRRERQRHECDPEWKKRREVAREREQDETGGRTGCQGAEVLVRVRREHLIG